MKVELKHYTLLSIADDAIGKCWDKPSNGECNTKRMHRVANQAKHASTIEHLSYNFDIDGISRACLQELARHRMSSFSVKSSRYTLGELTKEPVMIYQNYDKDMLDEMKERANKYIVLTGNQYADEVSYQALFHLKTLLDIGISNDIAKYCMPEAYKTSLVWTINARSLQNFLKLRTDKRALWEIRELAYEVFKQLPEDHKFLFEEFLYKEEYEVTKEDRELHFNTFGEYSTDDIIRDWLRR
jgi:thymidylate synthase (FAD)